MSEQQQPKFEVGQYVLVQGKVSEIMKCDGKTLLLVAIKSDLSQLNHHIGMKPCSVTPALRDGEYRLTVEQVKHLCIQAILDAVFETRTSEQWLEWVKERLDDPHYFDFFGLSAEEKGEDHA